MSPKGIYSGMKFEGSFKNKDAQNLIYRAFIPSNPRASVIFVHGLGEHSLKYDFVAEWFYNRAIAFFIYDQRGHGRSQGNRCHAARFDDLVEDLRQVVNIAKAETLREDAYLFGLSMGGLAAIIFALKHSDEIKGVVVSAPVLRLKEPPSKLKVFWAGAFSYLFPSLTVLNGISFESLTHDTAAIAETKTDKFSQQIISLRLFSEMTKSAGYALENARDIKIPILLLQGTEDKVVDVDAIKEFYEKIAVKDKQMALYEGLYHELLRETNKVEIIKRVLNWISERICPN
ncbi:MAG: alpha/beta hydrolase [Candidatus Omnitrophota bacterium]